MCAGVFLAVCVSSAELEICPYIDGGMDVQDSNKRHFLSGIHQHPKRSVEDLHHIVFAALKTCHLVIYKDIFSFIESM